MIQRWSAPLCLAAAMAPLSGVLAGTWGVDPVVGMAGDYATNPGLLNVAHTGQTDAALLVDAPTAFTDDSFKLSLLPSFRVGDTRSYSSVNSDYERVNTRSEFDSERSVTTATLGVARDSSLFQDYLSNGEVGVRRDSATAEIATDRQLSETSDFSVDAGEVRVRYGTPAGNASLVDYRYTSISPTLSWKTVDRTKIDLTASVGRYNSLDGATESRNGNLQFGIERALTPLWTLTASGGVSRALNRIDTVERFVVYTIFGPFIETIPVHIRSSQNGTVYSLNLMRQGELLQFSAVAKRQQVPTGFAYLSRQTDLEAKISYAMAPRWTLDADARRLTSQDPQLQGGIVDRTIRYVGVDATWQWTEHCTVTFAVNRITEHFLSTNVGLASTQLALTLSRKFNHFNFQ